MKRDAYGDDGGDGPMYKRQRHSDDEVTFLIPSKVAGSVIGKGGLNISKLRNQRALCASARYLSTLSAPRRRVLSRYSRLSVLTSRGSRRRRVRGYSVCWLSVPPPPPPRTRRPPTPTPTPRHEQYKASITVPDCPGPERVLSISASDLDTTMEVIKDILPKLVDQTGNNDDLDIRILIHQSRAGCVIGKGGAKIKELRDKTGARLKIFSNAAPQSTERVVQLVGTEEAVAAGIREVLELIRETPIKGSIQNYDPHNYDDFYAEEYGGFGAGQGGSRGPRGPGGPGGPTRPPSGPPPRMPMGPGGRGPLPPRGGPPMGRNGPPGPGPRAPFNDFGGPGGPRPNFSGPPRNFGGNFGPNRPGNPPPFSNSAGNGPETTTQVTIPKDLAGAIIGKAGSRIRKIRADSGAGIEIAEPLIGSNERIITITGTQSRIQMAQYLLQQSVHESNPNLGGGGRGNY